MIKKKPNLFKFVIIFLTLLSLYSLPLRSQSGVNDPAFNTFDTDSSGGLKGTDGPVTYTAILPDGRILISGNFSTYNGIPVNHIARIHPSGKIDATFKPYADSDETIASISLLPDKKMVIAGNYTDSDNMSAGHVTRLNASGSKDKHFKTGTTNGSISHTLIQPDGKILIAGNFTDYDGSAVRGLVRLNKSGNRDMSFNPSDTLLHISHLAIQSDGKLIVCFERNGYKELIRLKKNGNRDNTFISGMNLNGPFAMSMIEAMKIQEDDEILLIVRTGRDSNYVVLNRLNKNGEVDNSFDYLISERKGSEVKMLALQPDGKIIIGGNDGNINFIFRLNADGIKDPAFVNVNLLGKNMVTYTGAVQADGKIIVGGLFSDKETKSINNIARLNNDGSLDISFNRTKGANGLVRTVSIQANGKIIIGGNFSTYNYAARNHIARLKADGSLDLSFDPGTGTNGVIYTTSLQADGKIIITGSFTTFNGISAQGIARLNNNGSLDATFNTGSGIKGSINVSKVQTDGKIIIAGSFTEYNGIPSPGIIRLNQDGSLDTGFNPVKEGIVFSGCVQPDGKILIGGGFQLHNNTYENMIRLNEDGSLDNTFKAPDIDGMHAIALQSDGKIIISGGYEQHRQQHVGFISRLNADGTVDHSFNAFETGLSAKPNYIRTLSVLPGNKILAGGQFVANAHVTKSYIMQLEVDGSMDTTFNNDADGSIWTSALLPDGKIIIGGDLNKYNGIPRNGIARIMTVKENVLFASSNEMIGSEKTENAGLLLYPNPAASQVTLDNLTIGSTVRITDSWGKLMHEAVITDRRMSIALSNYSNGVYFITNDHYGKRIHAKLIINQ